MELKIDTVRTVFLSITCFLVLVSCQRGPVPVTDEAPSYIKVDTLYNGGAFLTGADLYMIPKQQTPRILGYISAIIALVLVVLVSAWYLSRHRRHIHALQLSLEAARRDIVRQDVLVSASKESDVVLDLLREKTTMVKMLLEKHDAMKMKEGLSYMDELETLQEAVQGYNNYLEELRSDKRFFGDLEKALDVAKGGLMKKTRALFGNSVSEEDYRIISCFYAGLDTSSISFISRIKPGTLRTKKSRFKAKLEDLPDSFEKTTLLLAIKGEL